jgi:hypothetical protein
MTEAERETRIQEILHRGIQAPLMEANHKVILAEELLRDNLERLEEAQRAALVAKVEEVLMTGRRVQNLLNSSRRSRKT